MNRRKDLINSIIQRKRVDITSTNYRKITKAMLLLATTAFIAAAIYILISTRLTYGLLFFAGAVTGASLTILYYLYRHIQAASLKGDTLILSSLNQKNKVTSVRSIKKVKTSSFLGIQFTDMVYNLDGSNNRAIIITLASRAAVKPEKFIKKAMQISLKERANHKPGSVSAA